MDFLSFLFLPFFSISSLSVQPAQVITALEPPPLSIQYELQRKVVEPSVEIETIKEPQKEEYKDPILYSCVKYLQSRGHKIMGDAIDLVPNLKLSETRIGDLILFHYKNREGKIVGHVAEILIFKKDGLLITESNKIEGKITQRIVEYNDESIIGFYRK